MPAKDVSFSKIILWHIFIKKYVFYETDTLPTALRRQLRNRCFKRNMQHLKSNSALGPYYKFFPWKTSILETKRGTSLVAQWLRIRLQGTRVRALVREDPTCRGATKPVRHNYWAHVPRARAPQQREATAMRSLHTATKSSPRSLQLEKARTQQRRPNTAKKLIN